MEVIDTLINEMARVRCEVFVQTFKREDQVRFEVHLGSSAMINVKRSAGRHIVFCDLASPPGGSQTWLYGYLVKCVAKLPPRAALILVDGAPYTTIEIED